MKPDGTYTVDEILQMCNDQLQSWERQELAEKLGTDIIYSIIRDMSINELANITGYYVSDDEPESDIDEFGTNELIDELEDRLSWQHIFATDRDKLIKIAQGAKIIE